MRRYRDRLSTELRRGLQNIVVTGAGTGVGKTVAAAILTTLFEGDYWKPIQCGEEIDSDTATMRQWLDPAKHSVHPPAYSFKAPLSPHHAARLENASVHLDTITLPATTRPLIIETVGGILVPLTTQTPSLDLFKRWDSSWVIVSRHYLGSINHTLLTIYALRQQGISMRGIIFNGEPNPDSEAAILEISQLRMLGRLLPERVIDLSTIQRYAKEWQSHI